MIAGPFDAIVAKMRHLILTNGLYPATIDAWFEKKK